MKNFDRFRNRRCVIEFVFFLTKVSSVLCCTTITCMRNRYVSMLSKKRMMLLLTVSRHWGSKDPLYSISTFLFLLLGFLLFLSPIQLITKISVLLERFTGLSTIGTPKALPYNSLAILISLMICSLDSFSSQWDLHWNPA